MRAFLVVAAVLAAIPAVAGAQDATERRRQQAFDNLRQLEQNQRLGDVERQLSNMEIRQQSDATLRAIQAPAVITSQNVLIVPDVTLVPRTLSAEARARDAELAASNQRLREISQAQRAQ